MTTVKRGDFLQQLFFASAGTALLPSALYAESPNSLYDLPISDADNELKKYSAKASRIVKDATCIDMLATYNRQDGDYYEERWATVPASFTQQDYEFVRSCGINIFGWGSMEPSYEDMLRYMARQNGIIASNPNYFERIDTKAKLQNLNASKKIGMLITNQNSEHFRTVDDVDYFYGLGQRVSQLTYNGKNLLGCGAFVETDTGLTGYGKQIVERMNKVGMAVDVSHCGDKTTLDGIAASSKPVLITHGACRAIAKDVPRAKTDEAIKAVAKSGGVIGIPILRFMIREKEPVTIDDFISHIDYVAQLVGVQYVGIGSDQGLYTEDYLPFEERKARLEKAPAPYKTHSNKDYLITIEKLNHPYRTYDIAEALIKKGYKDEHIKMVLGENFKRVLIEIFNH